MKYALIAVYESDSEIVGEHPTLREAMDAAEKLTEPGDIFGWGVRRVFWHYEFLNGEPGERFEGQVGFVPETAVYHGKHLIQWTINRRYIP